MKDVALAILCVGLCFYNVYRYDIKGDVDYMASFISLVSALLVIL